MARVHAEVTYIDENGDTIHSDICPPECQSANMGDDQYKIFLYRQLEEWLDKSRGTGYFYIKGENEKLPR